MAIGIQGVSQWQTWRELGDGTAKITLDTANLIAENTYGDSIFWDSSTKKFKNPERTVSVHPYTGIAVDFYGMVTNLGISTIAFVEIWGSMFPNSANGPGPAKLLFQDGITCYEADELTTAAAVIPGGLSVKWSPWKVAAATPEFLGDGSTIVQEQGGAYGSNLLLLSTLGYSHLHMIVNSASGDCDAFACMWKGISKEGVI